MENWKFALKSILSHKMRSLLTMLGIIIGVAAVVVIVALGTGMSNSLEKELAGDKNIVQIYFTNLNLEDRENGVTNGSNVDQIVSEAEPQLDRSILNGLLNIEGVENYYTNINTRTELSAGRKRADDVYIDGVSQSYFDIKKYKILAGRKFTSNDYNRFARIIMLDKRLAKKLFGTIEASLNQTISFKNNEYRIVGVYEEPNAGTAMFSHTSEGNAIMTNTQLAAEEGMNENALVFIRVKDVAHANDIGLAAAAYLTQVAGLKQSKYDIFNLQAQLDDFKRQMTSITIFIGIIAGISLLVGGIGVMNIMLVSVTERTREIGLRKALGATRGNILVQFLIEAMILTSLGGMIGILIAQCIVCLFNIFQPLGEGFFATISILVVFVSILFSSFVGIAFGVLPANKASKLNPIEALRYE